MIVLDSSAWIELFGGSVKGEKVDKLLNAEESYTSVVSLAEIADKLDRQGKDVSVAYSVIQKRASVLTLTPQIALDAGKLKNKIRKTRPKFGLFDAIHLATAEQHKATFVTTDADFSGLQNVMLL